MNYSIIFKMLSMVLGIMALAFSLCAGVSFVYASMPLESEAMPSWICLIALALLLAFAFYLPSRNAPQKLYKKEALCVIGLGWIIASLVGALPYVLILNCGFSNAFFEASSGLTTTGASVFPSFAEFPRSLMFWRCLSHWIGGMGVLVFFVAILSFLGSGGRILFASETSAGSGGGIDTERIQSGTLKIITVYTAISALCLTTFKLCGMGWFDGVCHMFGTVSTGGFSVYENSFAHYNSPAIYWAAIVFMFIGGMSFITILNALAMKRRKIFQNVELWTYLGIIIIASSAISLFLSRSPDSKGIGDAVTNATFQVVSLMTTTGFSNCDYEKWIPATHVIILIVMVIGGCAGSTSGGVKVSRIVSVSKIAASDLEKSFRPRVVRVITLNGKALDDGDIRSVLSFAALFSIALLFSFGLLTVLEPNMSLPGCVSAVIACLSNVGPGFSEVGPSQTYSFLSPAAKILLSILMIMGRLEFYAILALLMPSLWRKFQ